MNTAHSPQVAQCKCGSNRMIITGTALMRAICHCHYCQEYTGRDKSDFVIYRRGQVQLPAADKARFRAFKKPAFVKRGTCTTCGGGAWENVSIPLLPAMVIIPVPNHDPAAALPQPALHMFYHRRKADASDAVPKYSGGIISEWQFIRRLIGALLNRHR